MTDSTESVVTAAEAPTRKRRGLGITSLVLAILAVLGDLITIVVAITSFASFDQDLTTAFGLLAVFLSVGAIALIGGLILAGIALILAIIALIIDHGRLPATFGLILSLGVVVSHLAVILPIALGVANLPGLTA